MSDSETALSNKKKTSLMRSQAACLQVEKTCSGDSLSDDEDGDQHCAAKR
jgi:hypothetical protein